MRAAAVSVSIPATGSMAGNGGAWAAGNGAELVVELAQHVNSLLRCASAAVFQLLDELLAQVFQLLKNLLPLRIIGVVQIFFQ